MSRFSSLISKLISIESYVDNDTPHYRLLQNPTWAAGNTYVKYFHFQSSMSSAGPSPVFPVGLSPTKQSEIQLNNVELEGKVGTTLIIRVLNNPQHYNVFA